MKIYEIFSSIQGESIWQGMPCILVRLAGCNLRCTWCDTAYAFFGGKEMSVDEVVASVKEEGLNRVEITGGEPLLQEESNRLMTVLCEEGFSVMLETGGSVDCAGIDKRVIKIIDFKAPSSLMVEENDWNNLKCLGEHDEVKFVIGDRADYRWAVDRIAQPGLSGFSRISFSPVHGRLAPVRLAEWILSDNLNVKLNLQLHKYVWGGDAHGV